ncbi:MAG: hypothetical protein AB7N91_02565 [Candidatus Tectimicrobiota bacterium]
MQAPTGMSLRYGPHGSLRRLQAQLQTSRRFLQAAFRMFIQYRLARHYARY